MECFPDVPSVLGPRPVWLTFLEAASDWRLLLEDEDWDRLIEKENRPFGLLTASPDSKPDITAWSEFADHCVERRAVLVASWGINSTILDDIFDDAAVVRSVIHQLPTSEPLTSWHDDEPLKETLDYFLYSRGVDMSRADEPQTDWVRVVLVVGDRSWRDELHRALSTATTD